MSSGTFTEDRLVEQWLSSLSTTLVGTPSTHTRSRWGRMARWAETTTARSIYCATCFKLCNVSILVLPTEALDAAIVELTKPRSALDPVRANHEVYELLRNGVAVRVRNEDGSQSPERVQLIDWRNPGNNDFLLVSQFRVSGDIYNRRADLVGLRQRNPPLVFVELKASHKKLEDAYTGNLRDYRETIPALFIPNVHHLVEWLSIEDRDRVVAVGALR